MLTVPSIPITLSFADLLPDANGEIVIVSHGDSPQLSILTDRPVCDSGVADSHVTADGVDVAGWAYYTFEGGTRSTIRRTSTSSSPPPSFRFRLFAHRCARYHWRRLAQPSINAFRSASAAGRVLESRCTAFLRVETMTKAVKRDNRHTRSASI
jgi:hypothetical protein